MYLFGDMISRTWFLVGMVLAFEGLRIAALASYTPKPVGFALLVVGLAVMYSRRGLVSKARERRWTPVLGFMLFAGVLANDYFNPSGLQGFDWMMICFSGFLIFYNRLATRLGGDLEFICLFFGFLAILLFIPLFLSSVFTEGPYEGRLYVAYVEGFLIWPVTFFLDFLGVEWASFDGLVLRVRSSDGWLALFIGVSCSGAYSSAVAVSAFTAFVLTRSGKLGLRGLVLILWGAVMAYLGNVLRMLAVVLAGVFWGASALKLAHAHFGWIIFVAWISVFWVLGLRLIPLSEKGS